MKPIFNIGLDGERVVFQRHTDKTVQYVIGKSLVMTYDRDFRCDMKPLPYYEGCRLYRSILLFFKNVQILSRKGKRGTPRTGDVVRVRTEDDTYAIFRVGDEDCVMFSYSDRWMQLTATFVSTPNRGMLMEDTLPEKIMKMQTMLYATATAKHRDNGTVLP